MTATANKTPTNQEINSALRGVTQIHATRPIGDFVTWKDNPRRYIDLDAARELGESLVARGQIHNLVARERADGKLETIVGNRRVTGMNLMVEAGLAQPDHAMNVTIVDVDDQLAMLIAMAENISRESMNPIETCDALLKLAEDKIDLKDIARNVGLKPGDVADMIGVARLEEPVKQLIATRKRKLEWGRAMVRAGRNLRAEIMSQIEKSTEAYVSVQQINALMRNTSFPARHALFDPLAAGITVQEDLLEPGQGMIHDKEAFWAAQNKAVDGLVTELEKEGHTRVEVVRGQDFKDWEYEVSESAEDAIAVVEVANDGLVTVRRNLVRKGTGGQRVAQEESEAGVEALFGQDAEEISETSSISITERTPSSRAAEYLAMMRSAVATNLVAQDVKLAMGVTVAALMGERSVGLDWPVFAHGDNEFVTTFNAHVAAAGDDPLSYVMALDTPTLSSLYGIAVAIRLRHQVGRKAAFVEESIVSRVLAYYKRTHAFDLRANWTPDAEFLETLTVQELRVLAAELLEPAEIGSDVGHTAKVDLVRILEQAFASARDGVGSLSAMSEVRLKTWIPTYVF